MSDTEASRDSKSEEYFDDEDETTGRSEISDRGEEEYDEEYETYREMMKKFGGKIGAEENSEEEVFDAIPADDISKTADATDDDDFTDTEKEKKQKKKVKPESDSSDYSEDESEEEESAGDIDPRSKYHKVEIIIPREKHKTQDMLTRFELASIIWTRVSMIKRNFNIRTNLNKPEDMALNEIETGKCPVSIMRHRGSRIDDKEKKIYYFYEKKNPNEMSIPRM